MLKQLECTSRLIRHSINDIKVKVIDYKYARCDSVIVILSAMNTDWFVRWRNNRILRIELSSRCVKFALYNFQRKSYNHVCYAKETNKQMETN